MITRRGLLTGSAGLALIGCNSSVPQPNPSSPSGARPSADTVALAARTISINPLVGPVTWLRADLLIAADHERVSAIDLRVGRQSWSAVFRSEGPRGAWKRDALARVIGVTGGARQLVIVDVAGPDDQRVVALDARTSALVWTHTLESERTLVRLAQGDDQVVAIWYGQTRQQRVIAMAPDSGQQLWARDSVELQFVGSGLVGLNAAGDGRTPTRPILVDGRTGRDVPVSPQLSATASGRWLAHSASVAIAPTVGDAVTVVDLAARTQLVQLDVRNPVIGTDHRGQLLVVAGVPGIVSWAAGEEQPTTAKLSATMSSVQLLGVHQGAVWVCEPSAQRTRAFDRTGAVLSPVVPVALIQVNERWAVEQISPDRDQLTAHAITRG